LGHIIYEGTSTPLGFGLGPEEGRQCGQADKVDLGELLGEGAAGHCKGAPLLAHIHILTGNPLIAIATIGKWVMMDDEGDQVRY
jgi:hypothetical protein